MANSVSRPVTADAAHGRPPAEGLEAFVESFVRFLDHEETAIPGKEAAVSRKQEAVAVLHLHQDSTTS